MENQSLKKQSQIKSFAVAFRGIKLLFCNERNFRFHTLLATLSLAACFFFKVHLYEWLTVLILIAIILSAEALNTCIEYVCNFISPEFHPKIKDIKDIAAAAVLIASIIAIVAGCIIFIPYILNFFS